MKNEKQTKKGFFSILREAFSKTGGCCCGPGETCGGPAKGADNPQSKEAPKASEVPKAGETARK